jgi:hypothetical protein
LEENPTAVIEKKWGGGFCPPFVHVDKERGACKMSTLVHSREARWGPKLVQKLVHVVVQWSLSTILNLGNQPQDNYLFSKKEWSSEISLFLKVWVSTG